MWYVFREILRKYKFFVFNQEIVVNIFMLEFKYNKYLMI